MWSFLPPPPSERTSKICSARNTSKLKTNKDRKDDDQASSPEITLNRNQLKTTKHGKYDDQASSPEITSRQKLLAERVGIAPPLPAIVLSLFSHSNER